MKNALTKEALEVLDAIDRKGSFAAAADALYRVPSAITYTIRKLEEDLQIALFLKDGRRAKMTPAAKILLEQGRKILNAMEELEKKAIEMHHGWEPKLNIAIDSILALEFIYPLLAKFYQQHPQVEINLYEEILDGAWEAITSDRADLVIGASNQAINDNSITVKKIDNISWLLCAAADHPITRSALPLSTTEIEQHRFVLVRDSARELAPASARTLFAKLPVLSVPTIGDKINAISASLGIGFLPANQVKKYLSKNNLVVLPTKDEPASSDLYLAWKTNHQGKALRWFISQLLTDSL